METETEILFDDVGAEVEAGEEDAGGGDDGGVAEERGVCVWSCGFCCCCCSCWCCCSCSCSDDDTDGDVDVDDEDNASSIAPGVLNAPLDFFCSSSKTRCSSLGRAGGLGERVGVHVWEDEDEDEDVCFGVVLKCLL